MGLFGKLFDKKECDICGGEIGLLGNRKLEDGNMCKECAGKLSPWFNERRHSTVAEINDQLEYRKANEAKVESFNITRTLGEDTKILLDEDAGNFMVTSSRNWAEDNPDVIAFSDVTGCMLDIDEEEREIMREGRDGEQESYNPPRFTYYYDFYIVIHVRNPYFDEIRFKLNRRRVEIDSSRYMSSSSVGRRSGMDRFNNNNDGFGLGQILGGIASGVASGLAGGNRYNPEMGEEIRAQLLQVRQEARENAVAASAPKTAVTCPYCGATTMPDASGCCEYCGGALNG